MGIWPKNGAKEFSEEERHAIAVHEVGHAIATTLSSGMTNVHKVTILPAG